MNTQVFAIYSDLGVQTYAELGQAKLHVIGWVSQITRVLLISLSWVRGNIWGACINHPSNTMMLPSAPVYSGTIPGAVHINYMNSFS